MTLFEKIREDLTESSNKVGGGHVSDKELAKNSKMLYNVPERLVISNYGTPYRCSIMIMISNPS